MINYPQRLLSIQIPKPLEYIPATFTFPVPVISVALFRVGFLYVAYLTVANLVRIGISFCF